MNLVFLTFEKMKFAPLGISLDGSFSCSQLRTGEHAREVFLRKIGIPALTMGNQPCRPLHSPYLLCGLSKTGID